MNPRILILHKHPFFFIHINCFVHKKLSLLLHTFLLYLITRIEIKTVHRNLANRLKYILTPICFTTQCFKTLQKFKVPLSHKQNAQNKTLVIGASSELHIIKYQMEKKEELAKTIPKL